MFELKSGAAMAAPAAPMPPPLYEDHFQESRAFLSLGVTWVFLAIFSVHDIEDDTCTLNSFHKDFSVTFWWLNLTSLVASLAIQQYLWFITVLIYKGFLPFCFKVTYTATPVSCF